MEKNAGSDHVHLLNAAIQSFSWEDVTVTVKDRATKLPKEILSGVNGIVKAGEMLALMGPRSVSPNQSLRTRSFQELTTRQWLWQNNIAQCPRASGSNERRFRQPVTVHQRRQTINLRLPQAQLLRRARRCTRRLAYSTRDNVLCSTALVTRVCSRFPMPGCGTVCSHHC